MRSRFAADGAVRRRDAADGVWLGGLYGDGGYGWRGGYHHGHDRGRGRIGVAGAGHVGGAFSHGGPVGSTMHAGVGSGFFGAMHGGGLHGGFGVSHVGFGSGITHASAGFGGGNFGGGFGGGHFGGFGGGGHR